MPASVCTEFVLGDDPLAELWPEEEADLGLLAVPRRRREYTYGRTCARRALARAELPVSAIRRGPQRQPLWPPGTVGSITHCEGYVAASVAPRGFVLAVGIDAEPMGPLPDGVFERIGSPAERRALAELPLHQSWDRVLFSAKEAVYKAWFPLAERWLDFLHVEIRLQAQRGTFEVMPADGSDPLLAQVVDRLQGRFAVVNGFVLCTATLLARRA